MTRPGGEQGPNANVIREAGRSTTVAFLRGEMTAAARRTTGPGGVTSTFFAAQERLAEQYVVLVSTITGNDNLRTLGQAGNALHDALTERPTEVVQAFVTRYGEPGDNPQAQELRAMGIAMFDHLPRDEGTPFHAAPIPTGAQIVETVARPAATSPQETVPPASDRRTQTAEPQNQTAQHTSGADGEARSEAARSTAATDTADAEAGPTQRPGAATPTPETTDAVATQGVRRQTVDSTTANADAAPDDSGGIGRGGPEVVSSAEVELPPGLDMKTAEIMATIILTRGGMDVTEERVQAVIPVVAEGARRVQEVVDRVHTQLASSRVIHTDGSTEMTPEKQDLVAQAITTLYGGVVEQPISAVEDAGSIVFAKTLLEPIAVGEHLEEQGRTPNVQLSGIHEIVGIVEETRASMTQLPTEADDQVDQRSEDRDPGMAVAKRDTAAIEVVVGPEEDDGPIFEVEVLPPFSSGQGHAMKGFVVKGPMLERKGSAMVENDNGQCMVTYTPGLKAVHVSHPMTGQHGDPWRDASLDSLPRWNADKEVIEVGVIEVVDGKKEFVILFTVNPYDGSRITGEVRDERFLQGPKRTRDRDEVPEPSQELVVAEPSPSRQQTTEVVQAEIVPAQTGPVEQVGSQSGVGQVVDEQSSPEATPQHAGPGVRLLHPSERPPRPQPRPRPEPLDLGEPEHHPLWAAARTSLGFPPIRVGRDQPSREEDMSERAVARDRAARMRAGIEAGTIPSAAMGWKMPNAETKWQTPASLEDLVVPENPDAMYTINRLSIGHLGEDLLANPLGISTLEIGPPGVGKTVLMKEHWLRWVKAGGFATWFSTKGEIDLIDAALGAGAEVSVFAPFGFGTSAEAKALEEKYAPYMVRISPLDACTDWEGALFTAKSLTVDAMSGSSKGGEDVFFGTQAERIMATILFYAKLNDLTMQDVKTIINLLGFQDGTSSHQQSQGRDILKTLYAEVRGRIPNDERSEADRKMLSDLEAAQENFLSFAGKSEKQSSSIAAMCEVIINDWTHPRLLDSTTVSDIDPEKLVGRNGAFIMVGTSDEQDKFGRIYANIWERIMRSMRQQARFDEEGRHVPPPIQTLMSADEVLRLAKMDNLPSALEEGRGYGVVLDVGVQNGQRFEDRYKGLLPSFVNNGVILMHHGTDAHTMELVSKQSGTFERNEQRTRYDDKDTGRRPGTMATKKRRQERKDRVEDTKKKEEKQRPKVTIDNTNDLKKGEQVIAVVLGARLIQVEVVPYYQRRWYHKIRDRGRRGLEYATRQERRPGGIGAGHRRPELTAGPRTKEGFIPGAKPVRQRMPASQALGGDREEPGQDEPEVVVRFTNEEEVEGAQQTGQPVTLDWIMEQIARNRVAEEQKRPQRNGPEEEGYGE